MRIPSHARGFEMLRFSFRQILTTTHRSPVIGESDRVFADYGRRRHATTNVGQTLFLLLAPLLLLSAQGWAKHSPDVQEMPFKLYRNHLVVAVGTLGRLEKRNLVIDTGTNPTMVDNATAHELGLEQAGRPSGSVNVVDGVVPTYYSVLPTLDLGPIHCESMPVAVANLSWVTEQVGIHVDAVIGLDALARQNFQIDYESRKISFGAVRLPRSAVPMEEADRLLMVQANLNGIATRLMVDTGGSVLVLFAGRLPESNNWKISGTSVKFSNLAGDTLLQKVQLKELRIGKTNLSGSIALVGQTPACCVFGGILGISARQFKRVVFDFGHRLVGFELQDTSVIASEIASCAGSSGPPICAAAEGVPRFTGVR